MIYEPREDSFLLEKQVVKYSKGKKVLDMCAGSGVIALSAIKSKANSVLAVDINPEAVEFMKSNKIHAIKSNLFSKVKEKFDLITCNPPYLPYDSRESKESALATTGGLKGDELICKFIQQAPKHLEKDGKILLLVSSLTPMKKFNSLLNKLKLKAEIIASEKMPFEELFILLIHY